jgi:hypothetical protein
MSHHLGLIVKSENMGMESLIAICLSFRKDNKSSSALEPARRTHHGHGLIHHPLADSEVIVDPTLHFLALRDLFGFETGAGNNPHARDPIQGVCARVNRVSWTVFLERLIGSFSGSR